MIADPASPTKKRQKKIEHHFQIKHTSLTVGLKKRPIPRSELLWGIEHTKVLRWFRVRLLFPPGHFWWTLVPWICLSCIICFGFHIVFTWYRYIYIYHNICMYDYVCICIGLYSSYTISIQSTCLPRTQDMFWEGILRQCPACLAVAEYPAASELQAKLVIRRQLQPHIFFIGVSENVG